MGETQGAVACIKSPFSPCLSLCQNGAGATLRLASSDPWTMKRRCFCVTLQRGGLGSRYVVWFAPWQFAAVNLNYRTSSKGVKLLPWCHTLSVPRAPVPEMLLPGLFPYLNPPTKLKGGTPVRLYPVPSPLSGSEQVANSRQLHFNNM